MEFIVLDVIDFIVIYYCDTTFTVPVQTLCSHLDLRLMNHVMVGPAKRDYDSWFFSRKSLFRSAPSTEPNIWQQFPVEISDWNP